MNLSRVVSCADRVARRGKRLDKIEELRQLLVDSPPELLGSVVQMLAGEIPGGKIGVGYATLTTVSSTIEAESESRSEDEAAGREVIPALDRTPTVESTLAVLDGVRQESGPGSKQRRIDRLTGLFGECSPAQRDFLFRLLTGELRQGALSGLMVEAVSRAAEVPAAAVRRAVMLSGDLSAVSRAAMSGGREQLETFRVELFRPLQPMLASPIASLEQAAERIPQQHMALEIKIDGARVQVHRDGEQVRVYSRLLNDVTASVPEMVETALSAKTSRFVLDGEAYAVRKDGSAHSFQTTMRRFGRSNDVSTLRKRLPIVVVFFDVLVEGDEELIDQPLEERWRRLEQLLPEHQIARRSRPDPDQAQQTYEEALELGHEGLMIKDLRSPYEAGNRGFSWLKLKPTHTLDLVVLAVEKGSGRRSGWLSNLHLGALDERTGEFVMLGKTFKGLTDDMLRWQTEHLGAIEKRVENGFIHHTEPTLVVEIAFNNIQESPHYPAGMALRFARVKAHRPDKAAQDASTLDQVRAIFRQEHGRDPRLPE